MGIGIANFGDASVEHRFGCLGGRVVIGQRLITIVWQMNNIVVGLLHRLRRGEWIATPALVPVATAQHAAQAQHQESRDHREQDYVDELKAFAHNLCPSALTPIFGRPLDRQASAR